MGQYIVNKENNLYGISRADDKQVVVSAVYAYVELCGASQEFAIVWKDYKAGVLNTATGDIVIPICFDELHPRLQYGIKDEHGRQTRPKLIGFACFTNGGKAIAFDLLGKEDSWQAWEDPMLTQPIISHRTVAEIESEIVSLFQSVNIMPGIKFKDTLCSASEPQSKIVEQIISLLYERKKALNYRWQHSKENVAKIANTNAMLEKAVHQAIQLGEKAEQLFSEIHNSDSASVTVEVYPWWADSDEKLGTRSVHEIIVLLGEEIGETEYSPCFDLTSIDSETDVWNYSQACHDDGASWDEGGFHLPAYQDCYFLRPFQRLSFDNYILAFEDLATIKEFKVRVQYVSLSKVTKQ
jgi:hypothetical protein